MIILQGFLKTYWLTLIIVSLLLLSIFMFFVTGFIYISKQRIGVIEKVGNYVGTYKGGLYYFFPLLYRRVGYYKKGVTIQKLRIDEKNYIVKYQIENYKQWHYVGNHDPLGIVKSSLRGNNEDLSKTLIERFNLVGARFISLEVIKK